MDNEPKQPDSTHSRRREALRAQLNECAAHMPDSQLEQFAAAAGQAAGISIRNQTAQRTVAGGHPDMQAAGCEIAQEDRNIGWAIRQMHSGRAVTRQGWNGKGMFLRLQYRDPGSKMTRPYIYMVTADQQRVPWTCSQSDLLASDWEIFITE